MNKLIGLTIVLILVIFLFMYTNSQKSQGLFFGINKTVPSVTTQAASSARDTLETDVIPLAIQQGRLVSSSNLFQINNGHMIVLQIASDEPGEFYISGYDKHVFLEKGKMVVLSFLSTMNGRFSYELVNMHKILGTMLVTP